MPYGGGIRFYILYKAYTYGIYNLISILLLLLLLIIIIILKIIITTTTKYNNNNNNNNNTKIAEITERYIRLCSFVLSLSKIFLVQ